MSLTKFSAVLWDCPVLRNWIKLVASGLLEGGEYAGRQ